MYRMASTLVFDIETIPDVAGIRALHGLPAELADEEVAEYYAASDILLMPFERVTTSGTVIESLSHARAVITTDQGDMREWVRNGETGFLVGSVDDIVAVLSGLDRDVARRMGANGRALAFQRSWADSADRYASIFRELGRSV